MEIKNILIKSSVLVVFFSLIVLSGIFAWTDAPSTPPELNTDPPINVGDATQYKLGTFGAGNGTGYGLVSLAAFAVVDPATLMPYTNIDLVGNIETEGTITVAGDILPESDVTSDLGTWDNQWANMYAETIYFNKGNFNILDPTYQIEGTKYATYVSDMTGLKAETVGELEFTENEIVINLSKQEKGSDLWLFYNIVKKDTIIPFVSSQSPVGLYGYIDGENFIIKTISEYSGNVKLSYRLIGERIDNTATNNLSDNQNISTFINVDEIK
ncbi:MAG: hypothetical protein PHV47_01400 [Candidatus Pacebacteria bacterium]|nr:hypothetical protein [Candidatus Paceibacterota bacterium]MDD5621258.1 hypothetical protein [Candidatus Paceibacterota bacterium]